MIKIESFLLHLDWTYYMQEKERNYIFNNYLKCAV